MRGEPENIRFADVERLVDALGFALVRARGSHRIFKHDAVPELLSLQDVRGQAKAYQLRRLVRLIREYASTLEDDS